MDGLKGKLGKRAVKIEARNRIFLGFRSTVSLVRFDLSLSPFASVGERFSSRGEREETRLKYNKPRQRYDIRAHPSP